MARYNELLVGRYNRFLQKLLSMKGPASIESLNPELQATLQTFHGVENRYLEGWDRYGAGRSVGAQGVGNVSVMELRNPTGSNVVAVVESIIVGGLLASQYALSLSFPTVVDQASTSAGSLLDPRGRPLPAMVNSIGSTTGGGDLLGVSLGANVSFQLINDESQEIPLLPSCALLIRNTVTNQAAQYSWIWRERFLEDSERT